MLLHLSDLHFGTEQAQQVLALQRLCQELQPELVVVSGDVTQRARHWQFVRAKHFLESLNCPYLVIPGNHDIPLFHLPRRIWRPFYRFKQCFGVLEPVCETPHFIVIGVNTIAAHHHTKGSISPAQIEQVSRQLQLAPAHKYKIVVTHQPFMVNPSNHKAIEDIPRLMLPALRRWSYFGLNALLHGHLHEPTVYDLNICFQLRQSHAVLGIQAGTALSHRIRHHFPNSVNVISNEMTVQRYDYDLCQNRFLYKKILWQA
ncbi:metallophosphoesterase family protein [Alkanindiges sp. WGS2144]|uniref:metallophosphoesterase family protein n=1 Tax=Alkanindiges sp. WGS2144 TaxID=3366808 RepID=UPI0037535741